jgi:hypothetical protein
MTLTNNVSGRIKQSRRRTRTILSAALLGAAMLLQGAGHEAHATESGLGFYQTADIYGKGVIHFDYDTFGRGVKTDIGTSAGLEFGVGPDKDGAFGRTELGFDYLVSGPSGSTLPSGDKRIVLNAKTQLYNNDASGTRVSLGVSGLGDKSTFPAADLHLLGFKAFAFGRVHAGLFKQIKRTSGGPHTGGLQLGFDKTVAKKFVVGGDWRSGPSGFLAPCVIYNMNSKSDFEVCVGRANSDSITPRYQTYLAFDYSFGTP